MARSCLVGLLLTGFISPLTAIFKMLLPMAAARGAGRSANLGALHTAAGRASMEPTRPGALAKAADGDAAMAIGSDMSAAADMMSVERCARWHGCGAHTHAA